MRFVVSSPTDRIVLRDSRSSQTVGWWLLADGAKGWSGTPSIREGTTEAKGVDGDYWPPSMTQGARTVTLSGAVCARSTMELARALDRIDALAGARLTVACEDAHGRRSAEGFLSDDPDPRVYPDERTATFELVITCPDPRLYGPWVAYPGTGKARVANHGTAPSFPRVHAEGSTLTTLTLACGGQTVEWRGSATSLDLDLSDLAPSAGSLSQDNAFAVPPGGAKVAVSATGTDAAVTLYGRDAWR